MSVLLGHIVLNFLLGVQLDEDLVKAQQAAYSVAGVDEEVRPLVTWTRLRLLRGKMNFGLLIHPTESLALLCMIDRFQGRSGHTSTYLTIRSSVQSDILWES